MLKNWTAHNDYQQFIILNLSSFYKVSSKRIVELESSSYMGLAFIHKKPSWLKAMERNL